MSQSIHENFLLFGYNHLLLQPICFWFLIFWRKHKRYLACFRECVKSIRENSFQLFMLTMFVMIFRIDFQNYICSHKKTDRIIEIISIFHFNSLISYYPFMKMSIKKNCFELSGIKSKYIHEENEKI